MQTIDYGLLVLYLRRTFRQGDGDGDGGLTRLTRINRISLCRYTVGVQPRQLQATTLRRVARARLTVDQRQAAGMRVERCVGVPPGMKPRTGLPGVIDWAVMVDTLRETYPLQRWKGLADDIGVNDNVITRWGRDIPRPSQGNVAALLNVAYARLTDAEFDQCLLRDYEQEVAA